METEIHDDVVKWKHFPRYWPFVRWIHRSPVNSPHKGQWGGALMFTSITAWINGSGNNREAGDLRRHHAHYDVTAMIIMPSALGMVWYLSKTGFRFHYPHPHPRMSGLWRQTITRSFPDSKVYGANMGPTWDLSAPDGPHVGPMNLAFSFSVVSSSIATWSFICWSLNKRFAILQITQLNFLFNGTSG